MKAPGLKHKLGNYYELKNNALVQLPKSFSLKAKLSQAS